LKHRLIPGEIKQKEFFKEMMLVTVGKYMNDFIGLLRETWIL
jgi:hypothetical protein